MICQEKVKWEARLGHSNHIVKVGVDATFEQFKPWCIEGQGQIIGSNDWFIAQQKCHLEVILSLRQKLKIENFLITWNKVEQCLNCW